MSYRGWRVVAWTPYGRKVTASILAAYLKRDHAAGLVDEWYLCMNTGSGGEDNIAWAQQFAAEEDWVSLKPVPGTEPWRGKFVIPSNWRGPSPRGYGWDIHKFWSYLSNSQTIYLRLDDDIVYMHDNAVTEMARASISGINGNIFASFPVIINNAVIAWYQRQQNCIPNSFGEVLSPACLALTSNGVAAYQDLAFATGLHEYALGKIETGDAASLMLDDPVILPATRFSISAFTLCGGFLDDLGGLVELDEETWLSAGYPERSGRRNQIVPKALVSHFSFNPTWPGMLTTGLLDRYRALAEAL